jgi:hypothetical protein
MLMRFLRAFSDQTENALDLFWRHGLTANHSDLKSVNSSTGRLVQTARQNFAVIAFEVEIWV